MANRKKYHVTPDGEGGWQGKIEGGQRASVKGPTKQDVVDKTKEIAKNTGNSQLIIHDKKGLIQTEYTYDNDPYPPKG
jgi:hypothetical protein